MCPWYVITSALAETSEVSKTIKLFSPFRCAATKTWRSTASVTWTGKPVGAAAGSPSVVTQALGPSDSITTESANVRHDLHNLRNYDYLADLYWKILWLWLTFCYRAYKMPGFRNGAVSSSYVQLALQSDGGIGNKISKLYTPWFHGDNFKSYLTCFS